MTITPGPWKLKFEPVGNPVDHSDCPFAHFLTGKDDEWDEVSNTGFHLAGIMNEDDARLMAAAPDLFAAVTEAFGCFNAAIVEGWYDALADGDITRIRDLWTRRLSHACDQFPAALDKATGRS